MVLASSVCDRVSFFLHPDPGVAAAVIVAGGADREISLAAVERLSGGVVRFDHQDDIAVRECVFQGMQEGGCDAAASHCWVNREIDDARLPLVAIANGAADDLAMTAGDKEATSGQDVEQHEGRHAVGEATPKRTLLETSNGRQIPPAHRRDLDVGRNRAWHGGGGKRQTIADIAVKDHGDSRGWPASPTRRTGCNGTPRGKTEMARDCTPGGDGRGKPVSRGAA